MVLRAELRRSALDMAMRQRNQKIEMGGWSRSVVTLELCERRRSYNHTESECNTPNLFVVCFALVEAQQ